MPKTFRLIALSLVGLAVLLGILALGMGRKTTPPLVSTATTTGTKASSLQILVAGKDLAAGKPVDIGDLQSTDAPSTGTQGLMTSPLQAKGAIPARNIPAGTPLRPELFLRGLSSHLNPGERAIALNIDETSAVGHHIEPGDYVDVYLNLSPRNSRTSETTEQPLPTSRLLASRLRVLAIGGGSVAEDGTPPAPVTTAASGQEPTSTPEQERSAAINARASGADRGSSSNTRRSGSAAVLAVPPDDAAMLLLAAQEGQLAFSLRNPADPSLPNRDRYGPASPLGIPMEDATADDRAYLGYNAAQLSPPNLLAQKTPTVKPARAHKASTRIHRSSGVQIIRGSEAPRPLSTQ